ncbi:MAG: 16S rRNA (adenine(1518)-N(6)/adenine(1519)-N(6))-dimethyltransferase RsmA, partial [Candidatus Nealsonbacteria bacterium]
VLNEKEVKKLVKDRNLLPSKKLGQNFLVDERIKRMMIEAADIKKDDVILEIGPGLGALTKELLNTAKKVIAVEKDPRMADFLKDYFSGSGNLDIIQDDILKLNNFPKRYKLIGSLPFYITAPIVRKFLEATENKPSLIVFLVQKEVGQRITASPPRMSILSVSVQVYADPKIISYAKNRSFWPKPKVDSAIIKIVPLAKPRLSKKEMELFFKIVKAGFSQPRKQLINNLSKGLKIDKKDAEEWLKENNIQPAQRAETLFIQDWINLTKSFKFNDKA